MAILLAITYVVAALWISGGVFYWIFRRGKWYPSIVYRRVESFFGNLCGVSILLFFCWCIAWFLHNIEVDADCTRERDRQYKIARKSFENTYSNVFELLRERNRRELELRLDYDLRAARMIEELNSNSFSVVDSPCTNLHHAGFPSILIVDFRDDINRIKRQMEFEEKFPLRPLNLIEGGAVQFPKDDLLQSD